MTGNWFILYAKEGILSEEQEKAYKTVKDSLENEKSLKLVSFMSDGHFKQIDSPDQGLWVLREDGILNVTDGGEGFDLLRARFVSMDDSLLKFSEEVKVGGQSIHLTWYCKEMGGDQRLSLFEEKNNTWRVRPVAPESPKQLKDRIRSMLSWYANYFRLISAESSYFMPARIALPFKFYQHAIGLMKLNDKPGFARYFLNEEQALKACSLLEAALKTTYFGVEAKSSYSEEYAEMLDLISQQLEKVAE